MKGKKKKKTTEKEIINQPESTIRKELLNVSHVDTYNCMSYSCTRYPDISDTGSYKLHTNNKKRMK